MSHDGAPHEPTTRLRLESAPAGLALVQDLINTRDIGGKVPDLLANRYSAREWLATACAAGNDSARPEPSWVTELSERDLSELRSLRSDVQSVVAGLPLAGRQIARTTLAISGSGDVQLRPAGTGWREFAGAVWCEVFLSQRAGNFSRLKLCHNPACGSAFFDRSKNNSGVWHDVKMCGNAANLRASRARKRAAAAGA
jgi:hypothetical protein